MVEVEGGRSQGLTGKFPVQGETLLQSSKVGEQQVKTPDIFLRPLQWCMYLRTPAKASHTYTHTPTLAQRTLSPPPLAWHEEGSVWSTVSLLRAWCALHSDQQMAVHQGGAQ